MLLLWSLFVATQSFANDTESPRAFRRRMVEGFSSHVSFAFKAPISQLVTADSGEYADISPPVHAHFSDRNPFIEPQASLASRSDDHLWGLDDDLLTTILIDDQSDAKVLYETFLSRKRMHPDWIESLILPNRSVEIEADLPMVQRTYRPGRHLDALMKALSEEVSSEEAKGFRNQEVISEADLQRWRDLGEDHPLGAWAEQFIVELAEEDIASETVGPLFQVKVSQTKEAERMERVILQKVEKKSPLCSQTGIYLYSVVEHTQAFESMLEAILRRDAEGFMDQASLLALSFGASQIEARKGFIEAFTTLFDSGSFPSEGIFQKYLHFTARCGIFH